RQTLTSCGRGFLMAVPMSPIKATRMSSPPTSGGRIVCALARFTEQNSTRVELLCQDYRSRRRCDGRVQIFQEGHGFRAGDLACEDSPGLICTVEGGGELHAAQQRMGEGRQKRVTGTQPIHYLHLNGRSLHDAITIEESGHVPAS